MPPKKTKMLGPFMPQACRDAAKAAADHTSLPGASSSAPDETPPPSTAVKNRHRPGRYKPLAGEARGLTLDKRNQKYAKTKLTACGKLPNKRKPHRAKKTRDQELRDDSELDTARKELMEARALNIIDHEFLATLDSDELMKTMYGELRNTRVELEKKTHECHQAEERMKEEHRRNEQLYTWICDMVLQNNLQEAFGVPAQTAPTPPVKIIYCTDYDSDGKVRATKWAKQTKQGVVLPETSEEIIQEVRKRIHAEARVDKLEGLLAKEKHRNTWEARSEAGSKRKRKAEPLSEAGFWEGEPEEAWIRDMRTSAPSAGHAESAAGGPSSVFEIRIGNDLPIEHHG